MRGYERHVHVARFLDGFAAIHAFEHGQFARFFLNDAGDAVNVFAALASRHFAPDLFVGAARGFDGAVHVRLVAEGDFGELVFSWPG